MAEAIARDLGHESVSAGTHPPENTGVSENAIEVLNEIGVDISGLIPKSVDSIGLSGFDKIISMGCGVSCPELPIGEDWGLEDPQGKDIETFRQTREEIRDRLNMLSMGKTDA
tara:strand:- start:1732 stop:2070 length:339 start_codon:yes stop_codon:yes gene_type:complete